MVTNLIKSSAEPPSFLNDKKEDNDFAWLFNYWNGKKFEIYRIEIPNTYADKQFCDIASNVYNEEGLLLFALEIVVNDNESGDILLNPGNYKLPKPYSKNNRYTYFGYVIAESDEEAKEVFEKGMGNEGEYDPYQSFDSGDKAIIAAEFNKLEED